MAPVRKKSQIYKEPHYRALMEHLPQNVFLKDRESNYLYINRNFSRSLKIEPHEITGKNDYDFFPKELADKYRKDDRTVMEGGEILEFVEKYSRDGKELWARTVKTPVMDDDGNIIGMLGVFWDITESKYAEEQLKESESRLIEAERIAHVGNWEMDIATGKSYWSDGFFRICGLPPGSIEPTAELGMQIIHPDDRERAASEVQESIRQGKPYEIEKRIVRPDGSVRHVLSRGEIQYDDKQQPVKMVGTFLDITERKLAEEEVQRLNEELEERVRLRTAQLKEAKETAEKANRAKSEFLANMSHEIRTPLNAVTGFSELLIALVKDEKQRQYLDSIKTAGKSLLTLINDILDLSRMEAGMLKIQYSPVNPSVIFKEIEQIFKMKISEKNLSFHLELDPSIPMLLMLDEARLRQVLLNLVGNAVKFTEKGHVKLSARRIENRGSASRIGLEIAVEDTGIGIPKEEQAAIFESFRQQMGQSNRKYGGTGLGLSISKKLTQMMDGKIRVESTPGMGSIFTVTLKNVEIAGIEPEEEEEPGIDFTNVAFKKAPVLVVDDVESNRVLLKELMERAGLEVYSAENGQEAILMAEQLHPSLIVIDIRMPVMDGIEATRLLKGKKDTANIPVIALSASTKIAEKRLMVKTGFDGYLAKPVRMDSLFQQLCRYLECTGSLDEDHGSAGAAIDADNTGPAVRLPEPVKPELVKVLKNDIIPLTKKISGAKKIKDVKRFSRKLEVLAQAYRLDLLHDYVFRLNAFIENFDIIGINRAVAEFPELVKRLETLAHGGNNE